MKVLLLSNLFPTSRDKMRGLFVYQLAQSLSKQCKVHVVVPLPWIPSDPLTRALFPKHAAEFASLAPTLNWGEVCALYVRYPMVPKLSRWWQPQLMHMGIARAVRELHRREKFDLINAHWLDPDGIVGSWIANELNLPLVLSARGCDVNMYAHDKRRQGGILEAISKARAVTTVSAPLKDGLVQEGVASSLVSVIPNGVDSTLFHPRNADQCRVALGLPVDPPLVVCVSRLSDEKGVDVLLKAFALVRRTHNRVTLAMVGAGPMLDELTTMARTLGISEAVRFVGAVPHDQVATWLGAATMSCMPSLREGFPNAAMEALASGRPVVASSVGALPGMLSDKTGCLVPPGAPLELAEALKRALDTQWSADAIAASVQGESWDLAATKYLQVYDAAVH